MARSGFENFLELILIRHPGGRRQQLSDIEIEI